MTKYLVRYRVTPMHLPSFSTISKPLTCPHRTAARKHSSYLPRRFVYICLDCVALTVPVPQDLGFQVQHLVPQAVRPSMEHSVLLHQRLFALLKFGHILPRLLAAFSSRNPIGFPGARALPISIKVLRRQGRRPDGRRRECINRTTKYV